MATSVFISWSGELSRGYAGAIHSWLPKVIQSVDPFISTKQVKGIGWPAELHKALKSAEFGIVCVTPDNVDSMWLNFEAGALAARFDEPRLAPILFDLSPEGIGGPLRLFQAVLRPDKDQMLQLVESVNRVIDEPLSSERLTEAFDARWEALDAALKAIAARQPQARPKPNSDDRSTGELILARLDAIERQVARPSASVRSQVPKGVTDVDARRYFTPAALNALAHDISRRDYSAAELAFLTSLLATSQKEPGLPVIEEPDRGTDEAASGDGGGERGPGV